MLTGFLFIVAIFGVFGYHNLNGNLKLDNGLGLTPQMGWNSWNHFGCNVNQDVISSTIDTIVSTGLAKSGYIYVNIDGILIY